jgi:hypothetical protein
MRCVQDCVKAGVTAVSKLARNAVKTTPCNNFIAYLAAVLVVAQALPELVARGLRARSNDNARKIKYLCLFRKETGAL